MTCKNCGQMHRPGRCPPKRGNRADRKQAERAAAAKPDMPVRGAPIEGTGKPVASAESRNGG